LLKMININPLIKVDVMSRPTWITVTGVLLIIFGVLGMIGNIQAIFMPKYMGLHESFFEIVRERAEEKDPDAAEVFDEIEQMSEVPEWFPAFISFYGLLGVLFMLIYFYSGIAMLNLKRNAIRIAYFALGLSIMFAFVQILIALLFLSSFVVIGMVLGGIISLVIDLVLLAVIMTHDQSAFKQQPLAAN